MTSNHHADLAVKPFAVRAMLSAQQKEAIYVLREHVRQEEEKLRSYALLPTEQDIVIRAIALLCKRYKIIWPSDPRKSKGNPPRRPETFVQNRLYSVRATLTESQKTTLEDLRETIQRVSEKQVGHANLPTEQETVIRALAELARSRKLDWPAHSTTTRLVPSAADLEPTAPADPAQILNPSRQ